LGLERSQSPDQAPFGGRVRDFIKKDVFHNVARYEYEQPEILAGFGLYFKLHVRMGRNRGRGPPAQGKAGIPYNGAISPGHRANRYQQDRNSMASIPKTPDEIEGMRVACRLGSEVLDYITPFVKPGITTGELDQLAKAYMIDVQGTRPATLNYAPPGYPPFPGSICTSLNDVICHGIPGERVLKSGDALNIDITPITADGFHGDNSRMFLVGEPSIMAKRLSEITFECMWLGIAKVKPGNRLGDIGHAIQQHAEKNGTNGYIADDIAAAKTMSDNDAAMRLFASLGSWQQGSVALTKVLKETGNPTDAVAAESEPDNTGFGDIHWSLDNQVTFADRMACLDGSEPVLDEMGQVIPVHRMGLGVLPGARFKGGWGPENDGTYVLREFGLVGEKDRQVPVAIAVVPDDALDSTAREAAQALAEALEPVLDAAADNDGTAECQVPAGVPDASDEEPMSVEEFMAQ